MTVWCCLYVESGNQTPTVKAVSSDKDVILKFLADKKTELMATHDLNWVGFDDQLDGGFLIYGKNVNFRGARWLPQEAEWLGPQENLAKVWDEGLDFAGDALRGGCSLEEAASGNPYRQNEGSPR